MALIQRPLKHLGTRSYVTEVAIDPNDPILDNEVDDDFSVVYGAVNGNLDTTNLSPTAAIVGSQLSASANILGSQLSPTAGIVGPQLAAGTIGATELASNAVTTVKIFPAASTPNSVFAAAVAGPYTAEGPVATLPSMTTRGGLVLLTGNVAMFWQGAAAADTVTVKVYRDVSLLSTAQYSITNVAAATISLPIPCPSWIEIPPAGAHVYKFTVTVGTASVIVDANGGTWFGVEFA